MYHGFGTFPFRKRRPCLDILQSRFLRPPRESWAVQSSLEPWSSGTNWVWSHTTDSSPTRTRCQREALATWSLCLCKRSLVQRETVFLSIRNSVRTKISGHFWQASKECRLTLSRQSSGKLKNEEISLVSGSALWTTPHKIPGRCRRHKREQGAQYRDRFHPRFKSFAPTFCI